MASEGRSIYIVQGSDLVGEASDSALSHQPAGLISLETRKSRLFVRNADRWSFVVYRGPIVLIAVNFVFFFMLFGVQLLYDDVFTYGAEFGFQQMSLDKIRVIHVYLTGFSIWFLLRIIFNVAALCGKTGHGVESIRLARWMKRFSKLTHLMKVIFPDTNDPEFLRYMYVIETIESVIAFVNMTQFYFCVMPFWWCIGMECVYLFESIRRVIDLFDCRAKETRKITRNMRNRDLLVDIGVELATVVPLWPLALVHTMYWYDFTFIYLTIAPSFGVNIKAYRLFREYLREIRLNELKQSAVAAGISIPHHVQLEEAAMAREEETQNLKFGRRSRIAVTITSFVFAVLYGGMIVGHLVMYVSLQTDPTYVHDPNCIINAYICPATPHRQDCVYWAVRGRQENFTSIPDRVLDYRLLRVLEIVGTSLEVFPKETENWKLLEHIRLGMNRLNRFEADVGQWQHLIEAHLSPNPHLTHIPNIWNHPHLVFLNIAATNIRDVPPDAYLPSLVYLHVENTGLCLDVLQPSMFPLLRDAQYSGNILTRPLNEDWIMPGKSLKLMNLGLQNVEFMNTHIRTSQFTDLRHNMISELPDFIRRKLVLWKTRMAGNPICSSNPGHLNCEGHCDSSCNWWYSAETMVPNQRDECDYMCFCACSDEHAPSVCETFKELPAAKQCRLDFKTLARFQVGAYANRTHCTFEAITTINQA